MPDTVAVCVNCEASFDKEAAYVLETLFRNMGLPVRWMSAQEFRETEAPVGVYYGRGTVPVRRSGATVHIHAANYYDSAGQVRPPALTEAVRADADEGKGNFPQELLILYHCSVSGAGEPFYLRRTDRTAIVWRNDAGVVLAADIVASAFYWLTLENERQTSRRDELGRFREAYSPLGSQVYRIPWVDEYTRLLRGLVQMLAREQGTRLRFRPRWPKGAAFAVGLSHDVDRLQSWTFAKIKRAILHGTRSRWLPVRGVRTFLSVMRAANWSGNFRYIVRLEEQHQARSTFYFVAGRRSERDPVYSLRSRRIRRGIRTILRHRFFVGLHGSFYSFDSREYLQEEKERLERAVGRSVPGIRQHYLRFDETFTFTYQQAAGFRYDTTVGFDRVPGYRAGTALPYHPFDRKQRVPMPLVEIPMILMDTTLWLENNLYLDARSAWRLVEQELERIRQTGGLLVINWHNNNIHPQDETGYTDVYRRILKWTREHSGWLASPDEIWRWWEEQNV